MDVKLMCIPNDDTQNYPFCRVELVVETFGWTLNLINQPIEIQVPKCFKLTNKKTLLKTLGTSLINRPMSPPSLAFITYLFN